VESELHDHCYGLRNYEKQKSKDLLNFASEIRKKEEVQRNHQQLTQQVTGKITNLVEKVPRAQIVLAVTNIPESQLTSEPTSHTPAIGLLVGFLTVIYFGWDKFWA
jgi:chemotaxis regulatin CheY-phosphate phosphatase CheZ